MSLLLRTLEIRSDSSEAASQQFECPLGLSFEI